MYSRFFPGNDANMFVKNVFRNFDVDKNGQIGRLEEISALKIYTDMITSNPAISAMHPSSISSQPRLTQCVSQESLGIDKT